MGPPRSSSTGASTLSPQNPCPLPIRIVFIEGGKIAWGGRRLRLQHPGAKLWDRGVHRRAGERAGDHGARLGGVDDRVDPQAGGGVAGIGGRRVARLDLREALALLLLRDLGAAVLELDREQGL